MLSNYCLNQVYLEAKVRKSYKKDPLGELVPWFSFSVLRNVHNWIVVQISKSPARRGRESEGLDLLQKSERPFVLHNSGIRRRTDCGLWRPEEEKASSRNDLDCHSTRTGSPLLPSSSHGPHSFLRCAGKTCRTMAPWPDSGGRGETATGAGGRRETGSRKRTAAAIR